MPDTATRPARGLLAGAHRVPSELFLDQALQHLSHFVIVVHVIALVEPVQELLHALATRTVDQKEQGVIAATLTVNGLQTLTVGDHRVPVLM